MGRIYMWVYISICACIYIHMCVYMRDICVWVYMHVCAYICVYIYICIYVCICESVWICDCIYVRDYIYAYTFVYIYTHEGRLNRWKPRPKRRVIAEQFYSGNIRWLLIKLEKQFQISLQVRLIQSWEVCNKS